jgi:hypothetical protein
MTDETAAPDPTPSSPGGRWRVPVLVAALVLVIVVVVAVAARGGDDDTDPAADPTSSSGSPSSPTSSSPTSTGSPSASDSPTTSDDPVPSPIIDEAVQEAIDDDFPAMVPAGVPAGWTVEKATYSQKRGGIWRIDLTDPNGDLVQVVQSKKTIEGIVHEYLGKDAQQSGQTDLSDYGTGKWAVWTSGTGTGLTKQISDTAALAWGLDQDTALTIAQELLTAEDAVSTEDG